MLLSLVLSLVSLLGHSPPGRVDDRHPSRIPEEDAIEWSPTQWGPQSVEEAEITHNALHGDKFGGDMVLPDDFNHTDAGIRETKYRWSGYPGQGIIPYVIDPSLAPIGNLILRAMEQYHRNTCIRFVPRTTQTDYIRIFDGEGCYSYIGRIGGRQDLSLGRGCHYVGLVVHELGHAIGLFHEHQRSDRDKYIYVYTYNVVSGKERNFVITQPNAEMIFTRYDYSSIMHYGNYAFSANLKYRPTMAAKNGQRLMDPYDKLGLTNADVQTTNQLYQC